METTRVKFIVDDVSRNMKFLSSMGQKVVCKMLHYYPYKIRRVQLLQSQILLKGYFFHCSSLYEWRLIMLSLEHLVRR